MGFHDQDERIAAAGVTGITQSAPAWRSPALMRTVPGDHGLIKVDPAYQQTIAGLIERAAPSLARAYDRHLGAAALKAEADWPVRSGFSKDHLGFSYFTDGDNFGAQLASRAWYSGLITERGSKRRIWKTLLFTPLEEAAGKVLQDVGTDLGRG